MKSWSQWVTALKEEQMFTVWFQSVLCAKHRVYIDASQSVNSNWEVAGSSRSVPLFRWLLLGLRGGVVTWESCFVNEILKIFHKVSVSSLKEIF